MPKCLILGCSGQDGSHLSDLLLSKGYIVIGMIRRSSVDNTQRIKHLKDNPNFILECGDITDPSSLRTILTKHNDVDEIYNLSAQSHVKISFDQPVLTWRTVAEGCLNILSVIQEMGLKARFYQASSSEMFGASYSIIDGVKCQNEDTPFLPQSPYAVAKVAAHQNVRLYREAYGMHASAGILMNHEGERRGENFVTRKITKWIGDYIKWMKSYGLEHEDMLDSNKEDVLYFKLNRDTQFPKLRLGNLEAFRDFGYAPDYVEAMWMMLQMETPQDFVICTGETYKIRQFLDEAFSCVNITDWSKYVVIDPEFYRPAEVSFLRGNNSKARAVLGWEPKTKFKELVSIMVRSDLGDNVIQN